MVAADPVLCAADVAANKGKRTDQALTLDEGKRFFAIKRRKKKWCTKRPFVVFSQGKSVLCPCLRFFFVVSGVIMELLWSFYGYAHTSVSRRLHHWQVMIDKHLE